MVAGTFCVITKKLLPNARPLKFVPAFFSEFNCFGPYIKLLIFFLSQFFIWCEVGVQFISFACGYPVVLKYHCKDCSFPR